MSEHNQSDSLVQFSTMLENLIIRVKELSQKMDQLHRDIAGDNGLRTRVVQLEGEVDGDRRSNEKRLSFLERAIWTLAGVAVLEGLVLVIAVVVYIINFVTIR